MAAPRLNRIIFILALLGVVLAIYVLQSFIRQAPIVCLNSGCELVRKHPASYLWGIPVPAFGLVGYSLLAALAFLRTVLSPSGARRALQWMMGIATFGLCFVLWFTYTELFIIHAICTWCAISAINMAAVFALTLKSITLKQA